jgi:hypothetical protein
MIPYWPPGVNRSGSGITQSNELQQRPPKTHIGRYDMEVIKGDHLDKQLKEIIMSMPKDKDIVHIKLPSTVHHKRKIMFRGQRSCS